MRSKQKYLFNRDGTYYFIMKIPTDLHDKFSASWIKRSLKCSDISNAKIYAHGLLGKLSLSFTLIRSGLITEEQSKTIIDNIFPPRKKSISIRPKTFSELSALYLKEHSTSWTPKTTGEFTKILQNIQNIIGDNSIIDFDRSDCISVRDALIARELKPKTIGITQYRLSRTRFLQLNWSSEITSLNWKVVSPELKTTFQIMMNI